MTPEIEIRQYQEGDEEEIVQLLELTWGKWPNYDIECSPLEHWMWKYIEKPYPTKHGIVVGISDGKVNSCMHTSEINIKLGDTVVRASQSMDMAVHPDFRRQGISVKLRSKIDEIRKTTGVNISYGISGNPIITQSIKKLGGIPFPHPMVTYMHITDLDTHLTHKNIKKPEIEKLGYRILQATKTIGSSLRPKKQQVHSEDYQIKTIEQFDDKINAFWSRIGHSYKFKSKTEQEYLNWRYANPKGGNYEITTIERDNELLGYIVVRINSILPDYPEGYIIDAISIPGRVDILNTLLEHAISKFRLKGLNSIQYLSFKGTPTSNLLENFHVIGQEMTNFIIPYQKEIDVTPLQTTKIDEICLQYGDTDWI